MKKYENLWGMTSRTRHDAYIQFIPSVAEWRCWVFRNRILGIYEKVPMAGEAHLRTRSPGRNCDYGWGIATRYSAPAGIEETALAATKALKLDFGAADLLLGPNGEVSILEVNTAPGFETLQHGGANNLAREIISWGRSGYPEAAWRN